MPHSFATLSVRYGRGLWLAQLPGKCGATWLAGDPRPRFPSDLVVPAVAELQIGLICCWITGRSNHRADSVALALASSAQRMIGCEW